jgi:predicted nucleotidyltransferase
MEGQEIDDTQEIMPPTPFPELNQVLAELVSWIRQILGDEFLGAYLQGSFAVGDFDQHSDVDFIAATQDDLTTDQVAALQVMHDQVYQLDSEWAKHLEGSYFPREVLKQSEKRGLELWYLDHGARSMIRSSHCNTLLVRWIVREKGVALAGPSPKSLVDPVSGEALRQEIFDTMTDWGREILAGPDRYNNRFYQTFIVLSYCRMLHDLIRGYPGSKREGAEWAKSALDPKWKDLIDRTWEGRPDPARSSREPADPADFERTLEFVEYVIREANFGEPGR